MLNPAASQTPLEAGRDPFLLLADLTWGGTSEQRNLFSQPPNPSSSPLEQSSPFLSQDSNGCMSKSQLHGGGSLEQQARGQHNGNGKEIQKPSSCRLRKTSGQCQCHQLSHFHGRKAAPFPIHKPEVNRLSCPRTDPSSTDAASHLAVL